MEQVKSFIKREWPIIVIALIGLVFKLLFLADRPLHHDESLHAQYGKYFANSFTRGFYKYDPLLHGPLLYNLQGLWHWIASPLGKSGVRALPVLLGFLISLSPLLFSKKLSRNALILLSCFFALSPSFTYWSRFLRHDFLVLAEIIIAIWLWINRPIKWIFYLGLVAGLHFATKENFFIHLVLVAGFLITEAFYNKKIRLCSVRDFGSFIFGFLIVSIPLYTAWFQYLPGFFDGLYRKSLFYWINQHHIERIKGPFFYNALIISIYEIWLIPIIAILLFYWAKYQSKRWLIIDTIFVIMVLSIACVVQTPFVPFFSTWLKIKNPIDLVVFFLTIYASLRTTLTLLHRKKTTLAFWSYLTFSSFFTYSFLGEKVPWLSIYPIFCAVILLALILPKLNPIVQKICLASLLLCIPKMIYINHISPGSANELISQVHTTHEYEDLLLNLQSALEGPVGSIKPRVLVLEENGWPLSWFLWGVGGVDYSAQEFEYKNYDFIFDKMLNPKLVTELSITHRRRAVVLRHYWWPNFGDISPTRWFKLAFFHQPWSRVGEYQVAVWIKKEGFFSE